MWDMGQETITTNHEPKRIRGGRGGTLTPFTPETSRLAARAREEKRIRLYAEGAGLAVQDLTLVKQYGEDAHIVERARTLQEIASTADAGKAAVMASAHLDKAQGLVIDKGQQETSTLTALADVMRLAAGFAALLPEPIVDVIDAVD